MGKQYAVKSIKKDFFKSSSNFECLVKEIWIHNVVNDCNGVMKFYGIYEEQQYVHLVLEYQKGGSLKSYLSKQSDLPESLIKKIMF